MSNVIKETDAQLKQMKESLSDVVDINYKRYNNKYMDIAAEHMDAMHMDKKRKVEKRELEAAEESADILFNNLSGRIIL